MRDTAQATSSSSLAAGSLLRSNTGSWLGFNETEVILGVGGGAKSGRPEARAFVILRIPAQAAPKPTSPCATWLQPRLGSAAGRRDVRLNNTAQVGYEPQA